MNRKNFIQTTGISLASILISDSLLASDDQPGGMCGLASGPGCFAGAIKIQHR